MRRRANSRVDPFDEWIEQLGLYRKQIARDGSCLFRAVSEQLFLTQMEHTKVRSLTLEYMESYKEDFAPFLDVPLDHHIYNMSDVREWGGHPEIVAMSRLFKVDFLLYQEVGKLPYKATDHGFERKIMLYFNNSNHYDCILSKEEAVLRGFCQSLIYETLYQNVFKLPNISHAVERMLHEKEYSDLRRDSANSADLKELNDLVEKVLGTNLSHDEDKSSSIEESKSLDIHPDDVHGLLAQGIPPFPYKVAKSLDKDIYRNIEYDAWNTIRREARYGPFDSNGFQAGVKVQIKVEYLQEELKEFEGELPHTVHGHIQSMAENKGDVDVYIVELGQRIKVPYMSMVPAERGPPSPPWHANHNSVSVGGGGVPPNYKQLTGYYRKEILPPQQNVKKGRKKGRENISVPTVQNPRFPASDGLDETTATQSTSLPTEPQTTSAATTNKIPNNSSKKGKKKWKQIDFC